MTAALLWLHGRNDWRAYLEEHVGVRREEAKLERKWQDKYNRRGHVRWGGRIYGSGLTLALRWHRSRVYHGVWGIAPYQSLYEPAPSGLSSLPQMPEWHLLIAILMGLSALSLAWHPLRLITPLL